MELARSEVPDGPNTTANHRFGDILEETGGTEPFREGLQHGADIALGRAVEGGAILPEKSLRPRLLQPLQRGPALRDRRIDAYAGLTERFIDPD